MIKLILLLLLFAFVVIGLCMMMPPPMTVLFHHTAVAPAILMMPMRRMTTGAATTMTATTGPICIPPSIERYDNISSRKQFDGDGRGRAMTKCNNGNIIHHYTSSRHPQIITNLSRHQAAAAATTTPIYFIHVGKTGGTSIDNLLTKIMKCNTYHLYIGNSHYDWSYIQQREYNRLRRTPAAAAPTDIDVTINANIITFLRQPIQRAISQFEYSKTLPWAIKSNATSICQTFMEYIMDTNKTWTQPIADGESGVYFLAGIFDSSSSGGGGWVQTSSHDDDDDTITKKKEYLRFNRTAAILLAAHRLESTLWFGILENVYKSMELLNVALELGYVPVLPKTNIHHNTATTTTIEHNSNSRIKTNNRRKVTEEDATLEKEIAKYIPMDIWLYEYAIRLFHARYDYFVNKCTTTYIPPELPPLPDFE